jgi:hypothetical protein
VRQSRAAGCASVVSGLTTEEVGNTLVNIPPALAAELEGPLAEPISLVDVEATGKPDREAVIHALHSGSARATAEVQGAARNYGHRYPGGSLGSRTRSRLCVDGDAAPVCWYGYRPSAQLHYLSLDLGGLPSTLRALYTGSYDGFKQATAFENGFPTSSELFPVSQYASSDEFEVGDERIPDLNTLVPLFFDWAGASICVELGDPDNRAGRQWSEASLMPYGDFWEMVETGSCPCWDSRRSELAGISDPH